MDTWKRYVKAIDELRGLQRKTRPCVRFARRPGQRSQSAPGMKVL